MSQKPRTRYVKAPDGREVWLNDWAIENGCKVKVVTNRWDRGIRDPMELIAPKRKALLIASGPKPIITPEKRKELLYMARYSEGQEDQKFILCDLMPCPRKWADWLMEELGLK